MTTSPGQETRQATANPFPLSVSDWSALRTAARWEKSVASSLAKVGVPVFLPVYHRMTRYRGKTRTSQLPLFSGYVFCSAQQFVENHRVPPSCRSRVAQILRPLDPDRLRQELLTIAGLVTDRKLVQERVVGEIGDRIRITGGPLLGHEGKIVRLKPNRYAVIVEVSMIGARFQVELSEGMVARN